MVRPEPILEASSQLFLSYVTSLSLDPAPHIAPWVTWLILRQLCFLLPDTCWGFIFALWNSYSMLSQLLCSHISSENMPSSYFNWKPGSLLRILPSPAAFAGDYYSFSHISSTKYSWRKWSSIRKMKNLTFLCWDLWVTNLYLLNIVVSYKAGCTYKMQWFEEFIWRLYLK